jgi:hypothetical protein
VQAFDLSFSPTDTANPTSGPSLDCPPAGGANVSGSGLAVRIPLTTGTSTKTAQDACEPPNTGIDCFCGACMDDQTVTCETDSDCTSLGLGLCGVVSPGLDRKQNNCGDGICTAQPGQTDRGLCETSLPGQPVDVDRYCSGVLYANGNGIIKCTTDGDCDAYVWGNPEEPDEWGCPNAPRTALLTAKPTRRTASQTNAPGAPAPGAFASGRRLRCRQAARLLAQRDFQS